MLLEEPDYQDAFQITYDDKDEILLLTYSGCVSLQDKLNAVDELCEMSAPLKQLKILVDVRKATLNLSIGEQEDFGSYLAGLKSLKHAKTAVVHSPEYNPNFLIDAIAFNKGFFIAQFTSYSEALDWLKNG